MLQRTDLTVELRQLLLHDPLQPLPHRRHVPADGRLVPAADSSRLSVVLPRFSYSSRR
jgi:hypothetical protein